MDSKFEIRSLGLQMKGFYSGLESRVQGQNLRLGFEFKRSSFRVKMGGVNHCLSHCRLAKFRGFVLGGIFYSAVIGLNEPVAWKFTLGTYKKMRFSRPITALCFSPYIEVRKFAKR